MAKTNDTTDTSKTTDAPRAAASSDGSVKETQQKLVDKGYSLDVDGIWTQQTTDAVRNFQVNNGLEPTGVVGRGDDATWKALTSD